MVRAREYIERVRSRPAGTIGVAVAAGIVVVLAIVAVVAFVDRDGSADRVTTSPNGACIVKLHGKGGDGAPTTVEGATTIVSPTGNAAGWGGRQWSYFPSARYDEARAVITDAIVSTGCTRVALNGFSNGAAFAAALYCRGETFDGRLVGVMIDDPVTDHAVDGCAPAAGIPVALYWTGALEGQAVPGWDCASADWTCDGGTTIGITAYAAALRTAPVASPHTDHVANADAPEPARWLAG